MTADVVVIGAGLSGLSAAKLLHEHGVSVIVLEARDRVGGRTLTRRDDKFDYVDMGGAYVGPSQDHILRLADEVGVESYVLHDELDVLHIKKGRPLICEGTFPSFSNFFATIDLLHAVKILEKMMETVPSREPWLCPAAEVWDCMTFKHFLDKHLWTESGHDFFRAMCQTNIAAEPSQISLLWYLWYVKQCGGTRRIWEMSNGAQERKFKGGSMTISERVAAKLGDKVKLKEVVVHIDQATTPGRVRVTSLSGNIFEASRVILAVPYPLISKMVFDPPLSPHKIQLIQRVPIGSTIKNQFFYETPFWREKGFNGFVSCADGSCILGNIVDDVKPDGSHPALTGFLLASHARDMQALSKEKRMEVCAKSISHAFGCKEIKQPIHYEEQNWMGEQFSGGCYTSYYPTGVMTQFGRHMREVEGCLYFAGTETASCWSGYMNGAVEGGERAAREVLCAMGEISQDQIWQDEPPNPKVPCKEFHISFIERHMPSVGQFLLFTGLGIGVAAASSIVCLRLRR